MTQPALASVRRTPESVIILAAVCTAVPILALCLFAALARVDDIDSILFAYYGKRILAGQQLYVHLWDNKGPGIYWVDAAALRLAGGSMAGIVTACCLAVVGSSLLFFLIARRLYGLSVAAIGTVLACLYINLYYYHVGSNRPSTFFVFTELCVVFFYLRSFEPGCRAALNRILAGCAAASSICFRQTAVAAAAAILVHQFFLCAAKRQRWSDAARTLFPILAGGAIAVDAVVLLLWKTSDLSEAWNAIVVSNAGYFAKAGSSRILPSFHGWEEHAEVLGLPGILAAAAIIHAIGMRIAKAPVSAQPDRCPPAPFAFLVAWLPISIYLSLIGPHRALHYYGIALPALVMLATHGIWLLMRRGDADATPRFYVVLAVLWFGYMARPAVKHQLNSANLAHFQRFDDRARFRYDDVIETVLRHTQPEDPLFIWEYAPQIYWYTSRPQAQRYILVTLIDQWRERAQPYVDEVIRDLRESPPTAIVMTPKSLKAIQNPPADDPLNYHDLTDWLQRNYAVPADCEGGSVWIRRKP